ncbi:hypothetical protein BGZ65_008920 [Modicella reniformis]|uniref:Uncharacterized protein n=1 Tax=Modicella reniformis TaxID=1440133 RepID=A0A9P6INE0_9FUNG|nr:hypothetical protein BGZ65_008920 [Modicella reniformis]
MTFVTIEFFPATPTLLSVTTSEEQMEGLEALDPGIWPHLHQTQYSWANIILIGNYPYPINPVKVVPIIVQRFRRSSIYRSKNVYTRYTIQKAGKEVHSPCPTLLLARTPSESTKTFDPGAFAVCREVDFGLIGEDDSLSVFLRIC